MSDAEYKEHKFYMDKFTDFFINHYKKRYKHISKFDAVQFNTFFLTILTNTTGLLFRKYCDLAMEELIHQKKPMPRKKLEKIIIDHIKDSLECFHTKETKEPSPLRLIKSEGLHDKRES